jgi:ribulose-bisphosphate carboxylase large chain
MSGAGERIRATYRLASLAGRVGEAGPEDRARAVARESTLEVPEGVAPPSIEDHLLGRVEAVDPDPGGGHRVQISHHPDILDGGLPQLLNVVHGNISLLPGVRLVDLELPDAVLRTLPGPRFGIQGIREAAGAPARPLVASALKPVGLPPSELAAQAAALARAGVDVVKDDHSLADQASAPFSDRVREVAAAVDRANRSTGGRTAYYPNVTGPVDRILARAREAEAAGCGGLLLSPGLVGLEALALLARSGPALPILSHPSRADVGPERSTGVAPDLHFGLFHRIAGADAVIYVNAGGRFAWSVETCQAVNRRLREPLGPVRPALPVPAGGVDRTRAPHWFDLYGPDVLLLIGGSLLREADLESAARELVRQARAGHASS